VERFKSPVSPERHFQIFTYREAVFRICCEQFDAVTHEIISQRHALEAYLRIHPEFQQSLTPVELLPAAPEVAHRMARAAQLVGVGPMASVAGAMAQCAAQAGLKAGASEVIIENGGDIYLQTEGPVVIGLAPGTTELTRQLAFSLQPSDTPISICSSSGRMGHSMSLGQCDLATVVAADAALADAAATQAANLIKTEHDVNPTLECIVAIQGIHGILIVKNDRVGLAGQLPALVKIR
jgi:ApbE superfamily uncharacterized protein (UPF0280 family)